MKSPSIFQALEMENPVDRQQIQQVLMWLDTLLAGAIDIAEESGSHRGQQENVFQNFYIDEAEVRNLLQLRPVGVARQSPIPIFPLLENSRLHNLSKLLGLEAFDLAILGVCLGPEFDQKYERLFGYFQDDLTRRQPSVGLVLDLLCQTQDEKLVRQAHFSASAPIITNDIVFLFQEPAQAISSGLSRFLKLDDRIVHFLLGSDEVDQRLRPYTELGTTQIHLADLLLPANVKQRLTMFAENKSSVTDHIFYLRGVEGVGKQTTAESLCYELGIKLLVVDGGLLLKDNPLAFAQQIRLIYREARLQAAAVFWDGLDSLLIDETTGMRALFLKILAGQQSLSFLAGRQDWEPDSHWRDLKFTHITLPLPDFTARVELWRRALEGLNAEVSLTDIQNLANKFRLSVGQIWNAAAMAQSLARWRNPEQAHPTPAELYTACRTHSNRKLAELAQKITPHYTWDDIILPPDRLEQLEEICGQVRQRSRVYGDWGFDKKLALGKGLNALFAGPSGTGKTMAAEIIAGDLGLDLYKIDLSMVVSKYIGETEKNLARIFAEAESSNAILFFDEAEALFGKRSEIRDSHDRYANIEVAYLLQKMEEYDGVVILATNLRRNMDEAFVRRIHFAVEFPFPDPVDRQRIWESIWPPEAPLHANLDLGFMARHFDLTGGNIRNIALAAAFLAANDGQYINMAHLMRATKREYQKLGKVVMDGEFDAYARAEAR